MPEKFNQLDREMFKEHVHPNLRRRMRMFLAIGFVMSLLVVWDILHETVSIPIALISVLVGLLLGWLTSRIFHLSWNGDLEKVVGKIDLLGGIVLALYIIFEVSRVFLFERFVHITVATGTAITFALVSSALIGRVLALRRRVFDLLKKEKVI